MTNPNPLRDQFFLNPEVTFLNHGSFGATPKIVFDSYQYWQRELERQPVEFLGRRSASLLRESRSVLSNYLSTDCDNIVYVPNATTGLNIVARSLNLSTNDEVLATNHEYGALDRTWKFLAQKNGFTYINQQIATPMQTIEQVIEDLWKGVTKRTRVIFISHITSPTAMILPVNQICDLARREGILTIVDGAHAPGQIPLFLDELSADFYCGNLHKWLCAPKGSAFLYARPEIQYLVEPLIVSWGWQSETPSRSQFIDYLEWTGTRDIAAFLAVPEAIKFISSDSVKQQLKYCYKLAADIRNRIYNLFRIPALYPDNGHWYRLMGTIPLPFDVDAKCVQEQLYNQYKIEIPIIAWEGQKLLRFSVHVYNTLEDVRLLENSLSDILPA